MQIQDPITNSVRHLERRLRRTQQLLGMTVAGCLSLLILGMEDPPDDVSVIDEVRTRKLVVVDDAGVARVVIAQDPKSTQRFARSAGISIFDKDGTERGGMGTFDDGSVVMALDAPKGVGAPMRDRLGLKVFPSGAAHVMLLDNETRAIVKLYSDGSGSGGPQVFRWEESKVDIKTLTFDGSTVDTFNLDE